MSSSEQDIVLASSSAHRAALLKNAGIEFRQENSNLDERALEAPLEAEGILPADRAEILAQAKAENVAERNPGAWIIGCDQILALGDDVLHKPADMEAARRRLLALSGQTHYLYSAVVLVRDGETVWRHVTPCAMKMRSLSPQFIGRFLAQEGNDVLSSVGAYQLEKRGAQLFDSVGGDFFSVIGLPLLPLLQALRENGVIDG